MSKWTHPSGVSTQHKWYWDPNHTQIVIGGSWKPPDPNRKGSNCSFNPVQKSAAELRCADMIKVHNAEVKRNRDTEAHMQQKLEDGARVLKRLRSERAQLQDSNKRLIEQLKEARRQPPPPPPPRPAAPPPPPGAARKQVLELIRMSHPDKGNAHVLNRTQLTQRLNDLLELL